VVGLAASTPNNTYTYKQGKAKTAKCS